MFEDIRGTKRNYGLRSGGMRKLDADPLIWVVVIDSGGSANIAEGCRIWRMAEIVQFVTTLSRDFESRRVWIATFIVGTAQNFSGGNHFWLELQIQSRGHADLRPVILSAVKGVTD